MAEMMTEKSINVDVLVVGGGLNGLPFAIAVASAGLEVLVLEREESPMPRETCSAPVVFGAM